MRPGMCLTLPIPSLWLVRFVIDIGTTLQTPNPSWGFQGCPKGPFLVRSWEKTFLVSF